VDVGRAETFASCRQALEAALWETWGVQTITGLANKAGFGQMSMFEDSSEELLDRFYRVIVKGCMCSPGRCCR
jgi:hypothetical protein